MRPIKTLILTGLFTALIAPIAGATPTNRVLLMKHYDRFLVHALANCATCHLPQKPDVTPTSLANFPHNPYGRRLMSVGTELSKKGKNSDLSTRIQITSLEDSDGDGVPNEVEILLGHSPGDPKDTPSPEELKLASRRKAEFAQFLKGYRWQPFEPIKRPSVPQVSPAQQKRVRNPIDSFIFAEMNTRGIPPQPEASPATLLRRLTLDLIGLAPTPDEIRAFLADKSPNAYEKVVDRLLASPKYGERWGRHWMDVWRYSDWAGWADGGQICDSKPHIWRWRDWIIESLNRDKGYDKMVLEMLAGDEIAPNDPDTLRATGFLARNYKLLSREQWMEDVVAHTGRAFMGITMHCAKCHDHMYEPLSQKEYYRFRAIFETHNVRTDRIPGETNPDKDGLVRAYDAEPTAVTYLFTRGDERRPDKEQLMSPGVPTAFGGTYTLASVKLPRAAYLPDRRDFVIQETLTAAKKAKDEAHVALEAATTEKKPFAQANFYAADLRLSVLNSQIYIEGLEDSNRKASPEWDAQAKQLVVLQRRLAKAEAVLKVETAKQSVLEAKAGGDKATARYGKNPMAGAQKLLEEAQKVLLEAEKVLQTPINTAYTPRSTLAFPAESTGRRTALAQWLTAPQHPLTARVAVNHIWARHFGTGIVPTTSDFGRNGRKPSHPLLLDWLATELQRNHWQMKPIHRLIVMSDAYRRASTTSPESQKHDPDNLALSRYPSRRIEAELVRDNVLWVSGALDETMGGADIDQNLGLTSRRRSLYLRTAAEKQTEFLQVFDAPSVTECYERRQSVMPQQALALANSSLSLQQARMLARNLSQQAGADNVKFIQEAFLRVLARPVKPNEIKTCADFLTEQTLLLKKLTVGTKLTGNTDLKDTTRPAEEPDLRARENLIHVLFNHNDFLTIR